MNSKPFRSIIPENEEDIPNKYWKIFTDFADSYEAIVRKKNLDAKKYYLLLTEFAKLIHRQIKHPMQFEPYHKAVRTPFDYYEFGLEFFRPLIDFSESTLVGEKELEHIETYIEMNHNVILFANHQIEADPQAISLLLESKFPKLAEDMIFVAGERVVTDPLAVPFSMGRNLFCIYSKKYFDLHPERKSQMLDHNKKTIMIMSSRLEEGGKCIYIAPSGGRDRKNAHGDVVVSPFDPQSIELMYLLGRKASSPTHFFPLALSTHDLLPPPEDVQVDLGEKRPTKEAPIHIAFGKEFDMENLPSSSTIDKQKKKEIRAQKIWDVVNSLYTQMN